MIFAYTLDQVLSAQKWQTRRVIKPNERLYSQKDLFGEQISVRASGKRKVYEVGKSYAVQPNRGKKAVARILITGIRREQVGKISTQDAQAEGFSSREDFITTWREIHGKKANLRKNVWVIEFKLLYITANDFKTLYEQRLPADQSINYSDDISIAVTRLSGTSVYSGDYRGAGVGTPVSR